MIQRKPIRKKRPGPPRRGQPTKAEKGEVRLKRWIADGMLCVDCRRPVQWKSGYWDSMHLHHLRGGSNRSDWSLENLITLCLECHMKRHNCGGKPLPAKQVYGRDSSNGRTAPDAIAGMHTGWKVSEDAGAQPAPGPQIDRNKENGHEV